jgi:CDP-paratose 2-epimerase
MRYLITGGAGFIGANFVARALSRNDEALIYDDLSRPGVTANVDWLRAAHGADAVELVKGKVEDAARLGRAMASVDVAIHLAGQTAVTSSIRDPVADFESNALGTLNVLEAARRQESPPVVIYASTNKVYGSLDRIPVAEAETRYLFRDRPFGISEAEPLEFQSPYGCSKGAGDQYALDYARIYGLRSVVLRQSCIFGPRQMGCEEQGWMAWFLIAAQRRLPVRICGSGKQVRDVLFVDDLLDAYDAAIDRIDVASGQAYNIGGGPERALSVWLEFAPLIERVLGRLPETRSEPWRPGDQRVYVSDVRKAERELGWRPTVGVEEGVERLAAWVVEAAGSSSPDRAP